MWTIKVEGRGRGLARTLPTGAGTIIAGAWVFVVLSVVPLEAQDTLETLLQAVGRGDVTAQYDLGSAYMNGEGTPEDKVEAVRWWLQAAEQGL